MMAQSSSLSPHRSLLVSEPELVVIPAGDFLMGSTGGQDDEQPVHRVWVRSFAIGKFPVTNREYACFLQAAGHRPPHSWDNPRFNHPAQPVVAVSWFDAREYCRWLSRVCGQAYDLPSEAQWERAARGGVEGQRYPWGDDLPGWMNPYGRGEAVEQPELVGQDPPNGYGPHNMGDLVHVWCRDWYDADYYLQSPPDDPEGPATGKRRASRGGSWRHRLKVTRCAARSSLPPDRTFTDYGFRVILSSH
jgi:formylglycine-generating enzyme required for sulfatase activity